MSNKLFNVSRGFLLLFAIIAFILMFQSRDGNYAIYFNFVFIIAFIVFASYSLKEFQNNRNSRAVTILIIALLLLLIPVINVFF